MSNNMNQNPTTNYFAAFVMTFERSHLINDTIDKLLIQSLPPEKVLIIDNITYLKNETERAKDALPLMKLLKELKSKYNLSNSSSGAYSKKKS